jgi:L-ascorbate metabolism protein UlaG (beta-lactamase superfamily)
LKQQVQHFFVPLGVGAHLRRWGIEPQRITQLAWWQSTRINEKLELIATPARHFSGRWVKRNQSLWASYILRSNAFCLYLGGDSGYDSHFKTIGEQYGPFDLVILENGQYNRHWPFIHMHPEETAQAAVDLKAKALLPVHWGKFSLAMHAWNEPIERVVKKAATLQQQIVIPYFGEAIEIGSVYPLREWWQ